jgi:hypothetical protein
MPDVLAARGRPTGRGRPTEPLLHAVPETDRTRTALCGARVGGATAPWPGPGAARRPGTEVATCPECTALLESRAAHAA